MTIFLKRPGLFVSTQTSLVRNCHLFGGLPLGVTSWRLCGSNGPAQRPRTRFQHHAGGSVSSVLICFSLQIYTSAREIRVWAVPLLGSRMQVCPKRLSAVEGLHLPQTPHAALNLFSFIQLRMSKNVLQTPYCCEQGALVP